MTIDIEQLCKEELEREYLALREAVDTAEELINAVESGYPIWGSFAEGLLEAYKEAKLKVTK